MTGDEKQDRQEAQAMAVALGHWVNNQIAAGADAALLAAALLGLGCDLMAKAQSALTTRDALSQLAADIVILPGDGGSAVH